MSVANDDLSIFNIKHGRTEEYADKPEPIDTFFTDGAETLSEDHREAHCKKTTYHDRRENYYIKTGPAGQLLNPWSDNGGKLSADATYGGMDVWRYNKVPAEVFQYYLRFLQTKNKSHYLVAQRLLRNS